VPALGDNSGRAVACDPRSTLTPDTTATRFRRNPAWVRDEVLRLKALMPHAGVRRVAATLAKRVLFEKVHAF
jgi:hypothetical protein